LGPFPGTEVFEGSSIRAALGGLHGGLDVEDGVSVSLALAGESQRSLPSLVFLRTSQGENGSLSLSFLPEFLAKINSGCSFAGSYFATALGPRGPVGT